MKLPDLRNTGPSTSSGVDVKDTQMLSGQAQQSVSGTNSLQEYSSPKLPIMGNKGGKHSKK